MFITNIIFGILFIGAGVLMLKYNFQLTEMFSRNNVFERKLGTGSTFLIMQLLAIVVILWGTLQMVGLHDNVAGWLFSPVTDFFQRAGFR